MSPYNVWRFIKHQLGIHFIVLVQFPVSQITWQYKQNFKYVPKTLYADPVRLSCTYHL